MPHHFISVARFSSSNLQVVTHYQYVPATAITSVWTETHKKCCALLLVLRAGLNLALTSACVYVCGTATVTCL